jgi:hypothetical protein
LLYLAPPLLVADLVLVLKMYDHLCLARQCPNQSPSVRCGDLDWWPNMTFRTELFRGSYVYCMHHVSNIFVHNHFIIIVFADFKSVIEEYVRCKRSNIRTLHNALKKE